MAINLLLAVIALGLVLLSFIPNWDVLHKVATVFLALDLLIYFLR